MKQTPEAAYRLRANHPKPQDQEQRRQQQQQHANWNGNVQGATNDSNDYKPSVRIVDGYPVEYSCRDDPRENNMEDDLTEMELFFDYEMVITSQDAADVEGSIRSLEWSLLWNVARNLGLHNCNFRKQEPALDGGDNGDNGTRRLAAGDYVVGLSSLEFDTIDESTDFCTAIEGDDISEEATLCTPVVGRMKAHYTGDEATIRAYLLTNIEKEMNSDRVRIENVENCLFIGDRNALEAAASTRTEGLDSRNNSIDLAVVVSVVAGMIVLGLAVFLARGRRRRQQQLVLDADDDDLPTTSVPTVMVHKIAQGESRSSLQSSGSGDTEESLPERNDTLEEPTTDGGGDDDEEKGQLAPVEDTVAEELSRSDNVKSDVIVQEEPPVEPTEEEKPTETKTALVVKGPEDKENQAVAAVPPRPPLYVVPIDEKKEKEAAKSSKTLQPRRKRKKKKKKKKRAVLKRVSSRNSIDEMETIAEQDDEGSDDDNGSEFDGSEYSTDDEDLDPSALNGDGVLESSDQSSNVVPPSPIREEPRIRPLPPPWI